MAVEKVAVVGAGVAGLTAALSFARRGIACDIFEETKELREVGAGLQISPNASRILHELGVLPALEAVWAEPERIALASGTSRRDLAHVPVGEFARKRWGAPYGVLHRATLQQVLLSAVEADPLCSLHLGSPQRGDIAASITAATGKSYPLVVGADGVWSRVREQVPGAPVARFSGNVAWRFTVPDDDVPDWLPRDQVTAFLGPAAHLVAYPLKDTGGINLVAIASGISSASVWDAKASDSQHRMLMAQLRGWDALLLRMLASAGRPTFWPLYQVSAGRWQNGGDMVLIGDAAHAMMPFAAQGAAMAIEDAFALSARVSGTAPLATALATFEAERGARVARVRARGEFNRFAYHARGPIRIGRDLVLALKPPRSLAAEMDWLYGYRTP
ncbi:FAD-dependent monooxygenase [Pseudorhizobium sp. NPDC055634]